MSIQNAADDPFAANMATNIKTLLRLRGITAVSAYERLHMSRGTWYSHMNTGAWSARHLAELSDMLSVPVQTLYGSPDELLRIESFATPLEVIDGEAAADATPPRRGHLQLVP